MLKVNKIIYAHLLVIFLLVLPASNIFAYSADVENISGRKYYSAVKEVIDNAQKSIDISMFIINLRENNKKSKIYKLCKSLVDAKKRGANVRIILDQNIDFVGSKNRLRDQIEGKNENAFRYFKKNGIDVFYDHEAIYNHAKAIVVDEEIVVVGSTNWSQSALTKNNENSVLIRSKEVAQSFLEDFSKIKIDNSVLGNIDKKNSVVICNSFLEGEKLAGKMITEHDERAFDLYLLLLYLGKGKNTIDFDFDVYARYLGIEEKMTREAYRRQIIKTLRKLKSRYKLIKVKFYHGANAKVKLRDIEDKRRLYQQPKDKYFLLPKDYFKYGWNTRLLFRAKFCYLINLYMVYFSSDKFSWSNTMEEIGRKFNLVHATVTNGMMELKRLNIIEMEYASIDEGYKNRGATKYRLLGLYSPKKHKKIFDGLLEKYGEYNFELAKQYAKIVFKENDPEIVENIIQLMETYGKDTVKEAYDIVAPKAPDNPKRTHRYAVGIMKRLGR